MNKWLDSIRIRPEHERREAMNKYADLQIFKLKVVCLLGILLALDHWFK